MEIIRDYYEREGCYNYYFKEDNKVLHICFGGNLDLYWSIHDIDARLESKKQTSDEIRKYIHSERKYTFTITKENYYIYCLFAELYNEIKESRIFLPDKKNINQELTDTEEFYMTEAKAKELNERHKKLAAYQLLFDGKTIEWHSDDDMYDRGEILTINKVDDTFVLEFTCPKIEDNNFVYRTPGSVSIRFRNSGSTYDPYNVIFMRMFNKLQEYDPDYHQLHIEELTYRRTLKK